MKTKQIVKVALIFFFLLSGFTKVKAQISFSDREIFYEEANWLFSNDAKELESIFKKMLETTKVDSWKGNQYCKPQELLKKIKINDLKKIAVNDIKLNLFNIDNGNYPPKTKEQFKKGKYKNLTVKGLTAFSNSSNFIEFVTAFTGKNLGDINGEVEKKNYFGEVVKIKDIDLLRKYYNKLKSDLKRDRFLANRTFTYDECKVYVSYHMKTLKFDYPKVTREFKIKVEVNCNCPIRDAPEKIKSGKLEYISTPVEGTSVSVIRNTKNYKSKYGLPKTTKIKIVDLVCCKGDIPEDEDASYTEPISQPDQTIGYNVGLGFQNDFEDVSYCAGVEYLKRISDKKSDTYVGGGISYLGTSFNDFKTNTVMVGPKIQIHTPISHSGDTQWVNGLKGYYMFGNQKNGGFKDNTSGIEASIYSGFNIQLNEKTSIGVEFPVLTWENLKIKPEMGGDYEIDNTSLLLNKGNPLKLSIRHSF